MIINHIKRALSVPATDDNELKNIIRYEGRLGGQLFGPLKPKQRREFFCLDQNTWVWYEEWVDSSGRKRRVTTRYDVMPNGIYKVQGSSQRRRLSDDELLNFYQAVELYRDKVVGELERIAAQSS